MPPAASSQNNKTSSNYLQCSCYGLRNVRRWLRRSSAIVEWIFRPICIFSFLTRAKPRNNRETFHSDSSDADLNKHKIDGHHRPQVSRGTTILSVSAQSAKSWARRLDVHRRSSNPILGHAHCIHSLHPNTHKYQTNKLLTLRTKLK